MFRRRSLPRRPAAVVALVLASLVVTVPVAASASPVQDSATDDEAFDANETEGTIERVRYQLLGVAAVTGALLVGYIWHTDPQRRLRVATRRRDDRERAAVEALDDQFLLPVDADDLADDAPAVGDGAEVVADGGEVVETQGDADDD